MGTLVVCALTLCILPVIGGCGVVSRRDPDAQSVVVTRPVVLAPPSTLPPGAPTSTTPGSTPPVAGSAAPGAVVPGAVVSVVDNRFEPEAASIPAGAEVVWRNDGSGAHSIRPVDAAEAFGIELVGFPPAATYAHTFAQPGTYRYYCTLHGTPDRGMNGTIEVTG